MPHRLFFSLYLLIPLSPPLLSLSISLNFFFRPLSPLFFPCFLRDLSGFPLRLSCQARTPIISRNWYVWQRQGEDKSARLKCNIVLAWRMGWDKTIVVSRCSYLHHLHFPLFVFHLHVSSLSYSFPLVDQASDKDGLLSPLTTSLIYWRHRHGKEWWGKQDHIVATQRWAHWASGMFQIFRGEKERKKEKERKRERERDPLEMMIMHPFYCTFIDRSQAPPSLSFFLCLFVCSFFSLLCLYLLWSQLPFLIFLIWCIIIHVQDKKPQLRFGHSTSVGMYHHKNEDSFNAIPDLLAAKPGEGEYDGTWVQHVGFFAVFDGHGGGRCSAVCVRRIMHSLCEASV